MTRRWVAKVDVATCAKRAREGDAARRVSRIYYLARDLEALGLPMMADMVRRPDPGAYLCAIREALRGHRTRANDAGEDPAKWRAAIDKLGALWCVL